jgi:hypothetical protein
MFNRQYVTTQCQAAKQKSRIKTYFSNVEFKSNAYLARFVTYHLS